MSRLHFEVQAQVHVEAGAAGGISRGALTEISGSPGSGKTALALRLLAEHPEVRTVWIEPHGSTQPNVHLLKERRRYLWSVPS